MKLKEISAVLIVKNAAKTLKECLNSLKEFGEIVLLDNQSDDDTLQIAKDFAKDFP
ncbi:glycosyltransferase, partial [Campylobacter upsaliensis]